MRSWPIDDCRKVLCSLCFDDLLKLLKIEDQDHVLRLSINDEKGIIKVLPTTFPYVVEWHRLKKHGQQQIHDRFGLISGHKSE